jgi:hypothetical protein
MKLIHFPQGVGDRCSACSCRIDDKDDVFFLVTGEDSCSDVDFGEVLCRDCLSELAGEIRKVLRKKGG